MAKVRQVSFSPDEFIAGSIGLTPQEIGVFWFICSLIYSSGKSIPREDGRLSGLKADPRTIRAAVESLIQKTKIELTDMGEMMVRRCQDELERAARRMSDATEMGLRSGRVRMQLKQNQDDTGTNPQNENELSLSQSLSLSLKTPPISPSGGATRRGTRIDPTWQPTAKDIDHANNRGLDQETIGGVANQFRDYYLAATGKGATALDWAAKWRTWIGNHISRHGTGRWPGAGAGRSNGHNGGRPSVIAARDRILAKAGVRPLENGTEYHHPLRSDDASQPAGGGDGASGPGTILEADEWQRMS